MPDNIVHVLHYWEPIHHRETITCVPNRVPALHKGPQASYLITVLHDQPQLPPKHPPTRVVPLRPRGMALPLLLLLLVVTCHRCVAGLHPWLDHEGAKHVGVNLDHLQQQGACDNTVSTQQICQSVQRMPISSEDTGFQSVQRAQDCV